MGLYLLLFLVVSILMPLLLGRYMAKVFDNESTWLTPIMAPFERLFLGLAGIKSTASQHWTNYALDFVLFNLITGMITFFILCFQHVLPLNPLKLAGMEPWQAFNTICSFVSNTNWQSYSGEVSLSNLSQILGITFMEIIGAVSGLAVCVGFLRGLTHRPLGYFYQDVVKSLLYVFLPLMIISSLFFVAQGVPQTLKQQTVVHTVEGSVQKIAVGPVASLLAIKQIGTNGGGFYNANSAHPFENPNPLTNFVEIIMELAIPMGLIAMFGTWLKNHRQGWVIWSAMMAIFLTFLWIANTTEQAGNPLITHLSNITQNIYSTQNIVPPTLTLPRKGGGDLKKESRVGSGILSSSIQGEAKSPPPLRGRVRVGGKYSIDQQASAFQSGGNMEGKEVRFGIFPSILFTVATTGTSTGAVNNMHDSLMPLAGLVPLAEMMLNVVFGGVGVGLMGFLLYGIIAVFLTGLMVGRTPEIFGKKIEKPEMVLASLAILLHPLLILMPTAIAVTHSFGISSLNNLGPHGLTEILYAYTSAAANNGSAFAGLNANTPWYNISIGIVILLGRYISMISLLAIAGSLLSKTHVQEGPGTLYTHTALFTIVWVSVILIVGALTFVPVLVLGPIAEHLALLHGALF